MMRRCTIGRIRHSWIWPLGVSPAASGQKGKRCASCGLAWPERKVAIPLRDDSLYSGDDR